MPEFELIAKYLKPLVNSLANNQDCFGLADDAAIINSSPNCSLVLSKDMMVEGVHYDDSTSPENLAKKLLRVNLSDLAAMGASPRGYLLGLSLPSIYSQYQQEQWLASFTAGLREDQEVYNISLLGGDTVSDVGKGVLSLTIIGEVPVGKAIKRSGAKQGDVIMLTGFLGDAALALSLNQNVWQISEDDRKYLLSRLHLPQPRIDVGIAVREHVNAAIDVSDGLLADLGHIVECSGVGAYIYLDKLPLSLAAKKCLKSEENTMTKFWPQVYGGGDDYELVLTVPQENVAVVKDKIEKLGVPITEIGIVNEGSGVNLLDDNGDTISPLRIGYQHFS